MYDHNARVITFGPSHHERRQIAYACALILLIIVVGFISGFSNVDLWLIGIIVAAACVHIYRFSRSIHDPLTIELNRMGIHILDKPIGDQQFPWRSIESVKYSWLRGRICLYGKGKSALRTIKTIRWKNRLIARDSVNRINVLATINMHFDAPAAPPHHLLAEQQQQVHQE